MLSGLEKERGFLVHEQRGEDNDHEKLVNMYRSGSAPPTVDGSLSAIGDLFGNNNGKVNHSLALSEFSGGNGFRSEEEIRGDPAYVSYYYSNVNLNPRLPPPLLSKEDWRFPQRLHGGGGGGGGGVGLGGIGDRKKANWAGGGGGGGSLFSTSPGFNSKKQETEDSEEWGGDGLIGLPGLGLGRNQKSIAEVFQDDLTRLAPPSGHQSRPASRNAYENNDKHVGPTESQYSNGLPTSYSYVSLSRSGTPDPQHLSRVPIIGGNRVNSNLTGQPLFYDSSSHSKESQDLATALSGMSLSNGGTRKSMNQDSLDNLHYSDGSNSLYIDGSSNNFHGGWHPSYSNSAFPGMQSRIGSQMVGPTSFIDPAYLQYLRTTEYAAQLAAISDQTVDRNSYLGNSYIDLLQKSYLGNISSQQSSKHGQRHNGYYGNSGLGMGLSFPGSPLMSPLPNSAHGHNTRFSSKTRNLGGGGESIMGPWHLDGGDNGFGSSLLEEFKSNKTLSFELSEIAGHVVEFSADQYGSRFIQQKLETANTEEKNMVFQEIFPQALTLMTDVFGNYVIQKVFEHGMPAQRRELAGKLLGHVLMLSLQMYGCRVIQKAIEVVDLDQKIKMVDELDGHIIRCVRDQNGNHVIQKCIECVPEQHIQFIITTFFDQVVALSTHPYGCRVIQRVLEHCEDQETLNKVMNEVLACVSLLAQDQYGNYVIQHVLEHGKPHERSIIIHELAGQIVQMSQQKFASNVVEKCLTFGDTNQRKLLVNEILGTTDENEPLQAMMKDQFANYVVQKVLETCSDQERVHILSRIKVHLNTLKKYTYGKHIVARVEKLVAAGERRIAAQLSHGG